MPGDDLGRRACWKREADDHADDDHHRERRARWSTMSASVRPASTAERAIGSERKRSIRPLLEVLGEPERRDEAAEGHRLDDDPRNQEVDVVVARRHDRAAEHVDEQQHEHDRLHREGEQQVGRARDPHEVAPGEHQRVGDGVAQARSSLGSSSLGLRPRRLLGGVAGERQEHVVERRAPHRDVVDADAGLVEPAHRLGDRAAALADRRRADVPSSASGALGGDRRERRDRAARRRRRRRA